MKISRLVERLVELKGVRGDVEVCLHRGGGDYAPVRIGAADTERDPRELGGFVVVLYPRSSGPLAGATERGPVEGEA